MKKSSGCPKDPKEYEIIMCPQFLTAQPEPTNPRGPGEAQGSCLVSFQFLQTSAQTNPGVYSKAPISPCVYQRLKCKGGPWLGGSPRGSLRVSIPQSNALDSSVWHRHCGTAVKMLCGLPTSQHGSVWVQVLTLLLMQLPPGAHPGRQWVTAQTLALPPRRSSGILALAKASPSCCST